MKIQYEKLEKSNTILFFVIFIGHKLHTQLFSESLLYPFVNLKCMKNKEWKLEYMHTHIQRWSWNDYFRCFFTKCELTQRNIFDWILRSNHPEVFLGNGVLKICRKFARENLCWSAISIKLLCNFIEIPLRHACSPVNLLHIFRTPYLKSTSEWLLLSIVTRLGNKYFWLLLNSREFPETYYFIPLKIHKEASETNSTLEKVTQ